MIQIAQCIIAFFLMKNVNFVCLELDIQMMKVGFTHVEIFYSKDS